MYLMYVDESGDPGMASRDPLFILSGLVVHESAWRNTIDALVLFRRVARNLRGLHMRDEIHSTAFMRAPGALARIPKSIRLGLLRDLLRFIGGMDGISVMNVVVNKATRPPTFDPFLYAWRGLVQRFHNTMLRGNFPGPKESEPRGMVITDQTDEAKLRRLIRSMRVYNPVANRWGGGYTQPLIHTVVEDASHRDSAHSYLIQSCDVIAYFLRQQEAPNAYIKKKGGRKYFSLIDGVLCRHASPRDPQGILRL